MGEVRIENEVQKEKAGTKKASPVLTIHSFRKPGFRSIVFCVLYRGSVSDSYLCLSLNDFSELFLLVVSFVALIHFLSLLLVIATCMCAG